MTTRWFISCVLTVIAIGLYVGGLLAFAAYIRDVQQNKPEPVTIITHDALHLPYYCARYYNLSTDEWIECMLVGKK